jgi:hypothetical protein
MDFAYLAGLSLLFVLIDGLAVGCAKLGAGS